MIIFPTLYAKGSEDKIKRWQIWVEEKTTPVIVTEYGYLGGAQKRLESEIHEGKYVEGHKTTPLEQAVINAKFKWDKQKKKNYVEDPSGEPFE